jgi:hypothetical protein
MARFRRTYASQAIIFRKTAVTEYENSFAEMNSDCRYIDADWHDSAKSLIRKG